MKHLRRIYSRMYVDKSTVFHVLLQILWFELIIIFILYTIHISILEIMLLFEKMSIVGKTRIQHGALSTSAWFDWCGYIAEWRLLII